MTIEEAREEKKQIEAQIADLINDFVDKTGLVVRDICAINKLRQSGVIRDNQIVMQEVVVGVKLDIEL